MRSLPSLVALLVACSAAPAQPAAPRSETSTVVAGRWGGEGAELVVADDGAAIALECAAGHVDGPVRLGPDGAFNAAGTLTAVAGTLQPGEQHRQPERVRFTGRVVGDDMTLAVQYEDGKQGTREVKLKRGAAGHVPQCA